MHLYWLGVAADLWRRGDASLEWILREAAAGEIFAAGHAESGNDIPVLLSTTKAERVEGGYRFTGRKHFGSLTPVWTRFGLHGMDTSDPANRKLFTRSCLAIPRDTQSRKPGTCWACARPAAMTRFWTNVFVPDRYIARVVPAGGAGIDSFVLAVFAWALMGFGNIYYGLAKRALDQSIAAVKSKGSLALTRSMAYHPEIQHAIADMVIELESIGPHLESDRRGLVEWRRSRRHLARENLCGQIPRCRRLLARRGSGTGCDGRRRDLSLRGLRAIAPRCALGPNPSREFLPHA